jgi:signal transduction histidine kinase
VLDVGGQVGRTVEGLLRRTLPKSIAFHIERAENLWLAEIDPRQLESAPLNIVPNARDAMPDGGRITIEIKQAELDDTFVQDAPIWSPGNMC